MFFLSSKCFVLSLARSELTIPTMLLSWDCFCIRWMWSFPPELGWGLGNGWGLGCRRLLNSENLRSPKTTRRISRVYDHPFQQTRIGEDHHWCRHVKATVASLFLVRPGAPSSVLAPIVAMPGAPSSVLAPRALGCLRCYVSARRRPSIPRNECIL